jgi:GNAT superfamily N-acetyltransferase
MSRLTFRPATVSDLPFIVGLIVEDSVVATSDDAATATAPDYLAAMAAIEADPNQQMLIAEFEGEPVGRFQLTFTPGLMRRGMWRGTVEVVHIAPTHRNQGFGGEMMEWAVERCRQRGCGMVQLTSNKKRVDAHRFYRRLGFQQSHEGFKVML